MKEIKFNLKSSCILGLISIFLLSSAFDVVAIWTKLGSRSVSQNLDHDEILVTGRSGTFNAIKLTVGKADVIFQRVIVVYRNGSKEEMQIRNRISAGGETRVLNIKGRNRIIHKVVFYYTTPPQQSKKAKVTLYGKR